MKIEEYNVIVEEAKDGMRVFTRLQLVAPNTASAFNVVDKTRAFMQSLMQEATAEPVEVSGTQWQARARMPKASEPELEAKTTPKTVEVQAELFDPEPEPKAKPEPETEPEAKPEPEPVVKGKPGRKPKAKDKQDVELSISIGNDDMESAEIKVPGSNNLARTSEDLAPAVAARDVRKEDSDWTVDTFDEEITGPVTGEGESAWSAGIDIDIPLLKKFGPTPADMQALIDYLQETPPTAKELNVDISTFLCRIYGSGDTVAGGVTLPSKEGLEAWRLFSAKHQEMPSGAVAKLGTEDRITMRALAHRFMCETLTGTKGLK